MTWSTPLQKMERLQLEITSYCNAQCPQCERSKIHDYKNITSRKLDDGNVTLSDIHDWFDDVEMPNLQIVHLCGNIDEPIANPEIYEICEYFLKWNTNAIIHISTNGGIRGVDFWTRFGELSVKYDSRLMVVFAYDGLEDTNHIYRRNVSWERLVSNTKAFIAAGGPARAQFITFEHNIHQLDDVRTFVQNLGIDMLRIVWSHRPDKRGVKKVERDKKTESYERVVCRVQESFDGSNSAPGISKV